MYNRGISRLLQIPGERGYCHSMHARGVMLQQKGTRTRLIGCAVQDQDH